MKLHVMSFLRHIYLILKQNKSSNSTGFEILFAIFISKAKELHKEGETAKIFL